MKIAIDARELGGKRTGVGRYLAELMAAWRELPGAGAHEFVVCAPRNGERAGTLWEQLTLPRLVNSSGASILFAPAYTGPLFSRVPMVVAIHDVSFAAHPEWFPWREGLRRRLVTRRSAQRAARVLTVSDFSKREIVKHCHIDPAKVDVIYHGATALTRASAAEGSTRLVLFVGSVFTRRHVPELIQGFAAIAARHPEVRLAIVGDNRTTPHLDLEAVIDASGHREQVSYRAYVTDAELADLYSRAAAFVFLSDYEGFGMTPLEALAAGIPIVVLDTEVAREIYGPAAVYVERPEPALVEAALERVLFDDRERERLREVGRHVIERYSWRECAQRTLQVLLSCGS